MKRNGKTIQIFRKKKKKIQNKAIKKKKEKRGKK